MSTPRTRALASSSSVGKQRYRTYGAAISRINKSMTDDYYLEAITLIESLIADRLESRLNFLTRSRRYSFKTLGALINGIKKHETDPTLKNLVENDVDTWRDERNKALHEMAKIEDGSSKEWIDKMKECKKIAKEGEKLRKDVFKYERKLRP